ncbi:hypothetical protein ABZ635_14015 [Nocardiopsis sp. NPDC007018]|uniref:hypothetical protein n=1 Tax=Nocardiopsis sp. NPDC007018 TaxID=3155721 RepID=UPI0033DD283F
MLALGLMGAPAEAAACETTTTKTVSTTGAKATGRTTSCSNSTSWTAYGTLFDTKADSHSVQIQIVVNNSKGKPDIYYVRHSKGANTSTPWSISIPKSSSQKPSACLARCL